MTVAEYKIKYNVSFKGTGNAKEKNGRWNPGKIRNCIDCGASLEIRGRSKRCVKCNAIFKTGENNPFYGKKHTEETRTKLKKARAERDPSSVYKIPNTPEIRAKISKTMKDKWAKLSTIEKRVKLANFIEAGSKIRKHTSIEEKIYNFLVEYSMVEGEDFERNFQIGPYNVDFLLGDKYIIECFGDYWHKHPETFSGEEAENKRAKDLEKKKFLENKGYEFIHFWERDINKNMKQVEDKIEKFLGSFFNVFNWESCAF